MGVSRCKFILLAMSKLFLICNHVVSACSFISLTLLLGSLTTSIILDSTSATAHTSISATPLHVHSSASTRTATIMVLATTVPTTASADPEQVSLVVIVASTGVGLLIVFSVLAIFAILCTLVNRKRKSVSFSKSSPDHYIRATSVEQVPSATQPALLRTNFNGSQYSRISSSPRPPMLRDDDSSFQSTPPPLPPHPPRDNLSANPPDIFRPLPPSPPPSPPTLENGRPNFNPNVPEALRPLPPPPLAFKSTSSFPIVNHHDVPNDIQVEPLGFYDMITAANLYDSLDQYQTSDHEYGEDKSTRSTSPSLSWTYASKDISTVDDHIYDRVYSERIEPSLLLNQPVENVKKNLLPLSPLYDAQTNFRNKGQIRFVTKENVMEIRTLGQGQFGQIMLATTRNLSPMDILIGTSNDRSKSILVALKKLNPNADLSQREAFEKEVKFTARLKHPNVVCLLAVCDTVEPFMMLEYMENGDLYGFLKLQRLVPDNVTSLHENEVSPLLLLYISVQISCGMRYLSSHNYIHRDLATRNCLVGRDFVIKIADFGMSRNLYESFYYRVQGRLILPIRWMAFESFYGNFSVKSDVWSFGVTIWEVFSLVESEPYSELSDGEVIADAIKGPNRTVLAKPQACSKEVYDIMQRCWVHEPVMRADFEEIFSRLYILYTNLSN